MKDSSEPTEQAKVIWLLGSEDSDARRITATLTQGSAGPCRVCQTRLEDLDAGAVADGSVVILDLDGFAGRVSDTVGWATRTARLPLIAISGKGSLATAVDAMKNGAEDFLAKPYSDSRLREAVSTALTMARTRQVACTAPEADPAQHRRSFQDFIGTSPAMQNVYETIRNIARSSASVFIQGESGTGKELCAEALHRLSARSGGPLVSINCSAIPRDLMESEIFGHEAGAFTGATSSRTGAAIEADGGTLFLDEICEMDLALQAKLLRFIQTGSVRKVGGHTERKVDVRFVCATNRDPMAAVKAGTFRSDLFYRLHVLPIELPPLRLRDDDAVVIAENVIAEIAEEELSDFRRFDDAAKALIRSHRWPGNVRELLNVIRNVVVMNRGDTVTEEMLALALAHGSRDISWQPHEHIDNVMPFPSASSGGNAPAAASDDNSSLRPLWQQERDIIENAIRACGGNVAQAAARLGINASTIYRKRNGWSSGAA